MRFYLVDFEIRTENVALLLTVGSETQPPYTPAARCVALLREHSAGNFWISCSMRYYYSWQYAVTSPCKMWVKLHICNKLLFLEVISPPDLT
jgi:hypothetical protein